jgi:hypothetical protein
MTDIKGETLTIGTISVLRTLVELEKAGAIDLPVNDFVVEQRAKGDPNEIAGAIVAIRDHISGSTKSKNN